MFKKTLSILTATLLVALLLSTAAFAAAVSLDLAPATAGAGTGVTASGTADAGAWVSLKVLDSDGQIVFFDAVKAKADGKYSLPFKVPHVKPGVLTVVAGYDTNVSTAELTVRTEPVSGGGGAPSVPAPVESTTGSADLAPNAGGKISLSEEAKVEIPAGALQGTEKVEIEIKEVSDPPPPAEGSRMLGSVYEFTVGRETSYSFTKPVTLTFVFDPAALAPGEIPSVHYYDEAASRWVELGGIVDGKNITVTVEHFTKFAVFAVKKKAEPGVALADIAGHWAEGSIRQLVDSKAISGYPDGSFRPDNSITRAEFATVLVKAFQLEPKAGKTFDDTANHWAGEAIATATAYGIVDGYSASAFGPDDNVTREQMAVMISKAAGLPAAAAAPVFGDSAKVSAWAQDAVAAAAESGIISGYPDNTFRPQGFATRAEAATIIAKAIAGLQQDIVIK